MLAPTYLSKADRERLVEINQALSGSPTGEEPTPEEPTPEELENERKEIMGRQKTLPECSFEELSDLKQQLFEHFQKLHAIGSSQTRTVARFIQQVEFRLHIAALKTPEVTKDDPAAPRKRSSDKVSTKSSKYSWSVDFGKSD